MAMACGVAWTCGCSKPAAPPAENEHEMGWLEEMGRSRLGAYGGRKVVLISSAADGERVRKALAADRDTVMNDLTFDLAAEDELDADDPKEVAGWVRQWVHERYWPEGGGPEVRVELRLDPGRRRSGGD